MSKSLNSVCISGHLGRAPKIFDNDDGTQNAVLSLAVNNAAKVDGEWTDRALWTDVKVYGAQVPAIAQYLDSGSFVIVEGRMSDPRHWSGDDGEIHLVPVVVAKSVVFGPRTDGGNGGQQAPAPQAPQAPRAAAPAKSALADDSDIPF